MNRKVVLGLQILLACFIVMGKIMGSICLLSVLVVYCINQINWLNDKDK